MPKKPTPAKKAKLRPDVAETAFRTLQEAIGEAPKTKPPSDRSKAEKDPEAQARGAKGGKRRRDTMTPDELVKQAKKAAASRWPTQKGDG